MTELPAAAAPASALQRASNLTNMSWPRAARRPRPGRIADLNVSLAEQMRILQDLRANLNLHHETLEDPELMLVLAEGETSLIEVLDFMLDADLSDDSLIRGLKISKDTLAARLHRLEERRQSRRTILEQALRLLELRSLERPTATISLSERPPSLVVEEEAQVPARFFDLKPTLNRRLVKEAMRPNEYGLGQSYT